MTTIFKNTLYGLAATAILATGGQATTATVFDGIAAGSAAFNATVTAAGGTVVTDTWSTLGSGTSIDRGDYTITRNNGGSISGGTYGDMSGQTVNINPAKNDGSYDSGSRSAPADYFNSGVTLTFDSAVNSLGFEVGDWATCCHAPVTELFISFDGGAPITVASATTVSDGQFPSQDNPNNSVYEIFVAAFDDTGDFTTVSFWGNGLGEYLVFGGEVRYALIDQGSLPPSNVPLPATGLLLLAGMTGMFGMRRRRKS